jgi:hypothetical protein
VGLGLAGAAGIAAEPADWLLFQKGPVALKPQLEIDETFNDNITYREINRKADLITRVSPGFSLQAGSQQYNFLDLSYFYDRLQYFDNSELSANQHRLALGIRFEKRRFTLEGRDNIEFLSTPLGGGISIGGASVERTTFVDQYRLTYKLSERTGFYVQGTHSTVDYQDDIILYDSFTLTGTGGFQYQAFSRTTAFGEIYYGQTENDQNVAGMADYPTTTFVGGFIGVRGYFTDRLSGMAKAGYETRSYQGFSGSFSAPVVEISVAQKFTENNTLTFAYSRRQQESVQFVRSSYTIDSVGADYLQYIGNDGRLRGNLQASYMSAAYEFNPIYVSGERHDTIFSTGATLTYDVKLWFRVFGRYGFEYLNSNEPSVLDYTVNRVTFGVELGY